MHTLLRCLRDVLGLWRVWAPLLFLAVLAPILAIILPLLEKRLIDGVILARRLDLLPGIAILYASVWAASSIAQVAGGLLNAYLGERVALDLRERLFSHASDLSLAFSRREHSGRTVSLFVNDIPNLTGLFGATVINGLGSVIAILIGGAVMVSLSWQLAFAAIVGPTCVALLASVATRPLRPAARRAQDKAAEVVEYIQEHLTGMREVVAFGRAESQEIRFLSTLRELLRLRMRVATIDTAIGSAGSMLSLVVTLSIMIVGAYLVIKGKTTLGTLVAMQSLFGLVFQPATQVVGIFSGTQKALGAADRIYAFLDERPAVEESDQACHLPSASGHVAFERVGFAYQPGRTVLHDISITAMPGETIALVGPSGAGKSTLASLIARFYDPAEGRITLDGIDLRDLSLDTLRQHIGIVFQDTFLFDATVRENITLGHADATLDQVIEAAQAANAWEFIENLPNGLETRVGERGVQLSEGQKQRVAIARALLREPSILILDEPTSSLDARSEHLIESALEVLMRGRTTFVIAHRLATVRRADRIVVMDSGRVVEQGTHRELLALGGVYRELVELQFGNRQELADASRPGDPDPERSRVPSSAELNRQDSELSLVRLS